MTTELLITPRGHLRVSHVPGGDDAVSGQGVMRRVQAAFEEGAAAGLLHLATVELSSALPDALAYVRAFSRRCLLSACAQGALDQPTPAPAVEQLSATVLDAPSMPGLEYLSAQTLETWWRELDEHVRQAAAAKHITVGALLEQLNPRWRSVGRVTFHLAENKRDQTLPFAFLATYAGHFSENGEVRHLPLGQALRGAAGEGNRAKLLALLNPVKDAAERCGWVGELVETGQLYQPLAWSPREAYRFLQDVPTLQEAGLIVRVPDWWKGPRASRPLVSVTVGKTRHAHLGAEALLDFSVEITLDGDPLSEQEMQELLNSAGGLVRLRGEWVELDRDRLTAALSHWKRIESETRGSVSFFEAMRWLSAGAENGAAPAAGVQEQAADRRWVGVQPGAWLDQTLSRLRDPAGLNGEGPARLRATLRPYQHAGVRWLRFATGLGLGACLADDMGLGKTIQVLALLLHLRESGQAERQPSLLIVPASLMGNWRSEIDRFSPSLMTLIAHPAETDVDLKSDGALRKAVRNCDLVITTYAMVSRLKALQEHDWQLVILDEAQAIKNSGTTQARTAKKLRAGARIALSGTPIENRLSDLWSLFDFLNPGLLGDAAAFKRFAKSLSNGEGRPHYAPLRRLVQPYILRRLKTDRRIIADLPEKTEVRTFCGLTRDQAALYQQSVQELHRVLREVEGMKRRGVVLAFLMRLKQICNHPAQWRGDGHYSPDHSGKFQRLASLCHELAERQEKVLIFTQFREIIDPLAEHLRPVFGRPGLALHGGTAITTRRKLVSQFQSESGPPFFILSLKAGGTGLNLTAASHVVHFDRWWNPAVENQATDRAFRIGQKNNVLVHKFVCRGTVEEKIDAMIADKVELADAVLEDGGERLLTEMDDEELLRFVALDVNKASEL